MNDNLPDDCQGNDPCFPWNEPEQAECPICGSGMTHDSDGDLQCDDIECGHLVVIDSADFSEDFE
jgi:hypothetical protein